MAQTEVASGAKNDLIRISQTIQGKKVVITNCPADKRDVMSDVLEQAGAPSITTQDTECKKMVESLLDLIKPELDSPVSKDLVYTYEQVALKAVEPAAGGLNP